MVDLQQVILVPVVMAVLAAVAHITIRPEVLERQGKVTMVEMVEQIVPTTLLVVEAAVKVLSVEAQATVQLLEQGVLVKHHQLQVHL